MPVDFRFVDAHAHLPLRPGSVEQLLNAMDRCNIEKAIVVAGAVISPELLSMHFSHGGGIDVDVDNDAIRTACQTSSGRLLPFYFANPLRGSRPYSQAGKFFFGLKLAPIVHGVPFSDSRMHELIAASVEFQHPVYLHCLPRNGFRVEDLVVLAAAHPRARIIMGHGGVGHGDFQGIALIVGHPNIYFEVSGSFSHATRIAWEKLGAERVLFGSEYPLQDHRVEIEKMRVLDFPANDYRLMMRENALRLLHNVCADAQGGNDEATSSNLGDAVMHGAG